MRRYQIAHQAEADLREIRAYIALRDRAAAKRLLRRLRTKFALLARLPELGPARPELAPGLRSLPEGTYVIYYRPITGGIEIARVRRGAQDAPRPFDE